MPPDTPPINRRPLKTRSKAWAQSLARLAASAGMSPNTISVISVLFAILALVCFLVAPDMKSPAAVALAWLGAVAGIQLRLLCNMLDGMVAVEGGRQSALGAVFNEVPDRVADVLILVGAGYATSVEPGVVKLLGVLPLGWSCAAAALWTAYIRSLGAELTGRHFFTGPMAKPHRMAALSAGCLVAMAEQLSGGWGAQGAMHWTLMVILAGSLLTCWNRLRQIASALKQGQHETSATRHAS